MNIEQRVEIMDSQIGTEKFIIYSQEKANEEGSDKPFNNKMTKARSWTETIILALLCSMMLYTVQCLTGMAPEVMCYLIVGTKISMDIKEQRGKEESPIKDQEDTSKIKKREIKK